VSATSPIDIDHDDPRITAWAIGARDALSADEQAAIAARVAADPALAASVASLRALDSRLASTLRAPVAGLSAGQRAAIVRGPGPRPVGGRVGWLLGGGVALAAAAALAVVALSGDTRPPIELAAAEAPTAAREQPADAPASETRARPVSPSAAAEPRTAVTEAPPADSTATPTPDTARPGPARPDPAQPTEAHLRYAEPAPTVPPLHNETEAAGATVALGDAAAGPTSGTGMGGGGLGGDTGSSRAELGRLAGHAAAGGYAAWDNDLDGNRVVVIVQPNDPSWAYYQPGNRRVDYAPRVPWPFRPTAVAPLATFSIDVDTASLSHARRYLRANKRVPVELVRSEEIINAFHYDDARPDGDQPLAVHVDVAESPWQPGNRLVRVALTARAVESGDRAPANLVFLVDVSGSMNAKSKLPLLVGALRRLVDHLGPEDRVSLVTYNSTAKVVLEPTAASERETIQRALDRLRAQGYTNGGAGLDVAYDLARKGVRDGATNSRVILATDGDFNAGKTGNDELQRTIRDKARSGVMLSVLGFGDSGYDDQRLALLARHGNGRYAFIDSLDEAERVLGKELDATLVTAAKDVRVQVELNPRQALAYHQIGYESRAMAAAEFNQEGKDAGELGAGESVVAFYEIMPAVGANGTGIDPLKYAPQAGDPDDEHRNEPSPDAVASAELLTVKVRWVPLSGGPSQRLDVPVVDHGERMAQASRDFVFSAAAAAFAMKLQGWSDPSGLVSWSLVRELALQGGADSDTDRGQLLDLVTRAERIYGGP